MTKMPKRDGETYALPKLDGPFKRRMMRADPDRELELPAEPVPDWLAALAGLTGMEPVVDEGECFLELPGGRVQVSLVTKARNARITRRRELRAKVSGKGEDTQPEPQPKDKAERAPEPISRHPKVFDVDTDVEATPSVETDIDADLPWFARDAIGREPNEADVHRRNDEANMSAAIDMAETF